MILFFVCCLAVNVEITNGGAEEGDLTGWTSVGPVHVVTEQDQLAGIVFPSSGDFFFSFAEFPADFAEMSQTGSICTGSARIVLYGNVQTEFDDTGVAELFLLDEEGKVVSSSNTGTLNTPNLVWEQFHLNVEIPNNATDWRVEFRGDLLTGTFVNVFWDEIEIGILGDANCDGVVNLLDVAPFVDLLTAGQYSAKADINQDGVVDLLDVEPFVDLLSGG